MKHAEAKAAHPPFQPVQSSMISGVAYDPLGQRLHVRFPNGSHYAYDDVTADQHAALVGAESVGKHFGQHIRGKFKHRMVSEGKGK